MAKENRRMRRRLLSAILALVLVISAGTGGFADPRDTEFFTERYHGDVDYADMEYDPVDMEEEREYLSEIREMAKEEANKESVDEAVNQVASDVIWMFTMREFSYVELCRDSGNTRKQRQFREASRIFEEIMEEYRILIGDILRSPCSEVFEEILSDEDIAFYLDYEPMSEEEKDQNARMTELVTEFWDESGEDFDSWEDQGAVLGPIFLEIVKIKKEQAAAAGYDSYADYAYEMEYSRDYTPEEAAEFAREVREYILPLYRDMTRVCMAEKYREVFRKGWNGDSILDRMLPWLEILSDEMVESFTYMRDHGLYAIGASSGMNEQGFTTTLASYHEPFLYNYTGGDFRDFTDTVHEFGHFNDAYWSDPDWDMIQTNMDIAEVPSQALELLFTEYYPVLFGEEDGEAVSLEVLRSILGAIVDGARQDEFLQWVYAQDSPTLADLNEAYGRISEAYGMTGSQESYLWMQYPHSYEAPFYYISYGTSAAGALELWSRSQKDYLTGVNDYLRFTALEEGMGFQESFEALGMPSPLAEGSMKALADQLRQELDLDRRLADLPVVGYFRDVKSGDWFREAVKFVYDSGLMNGMSETVFAPNGEMTRAQLVTTLWRSAGEPGVDDGSTSFRDVEAGSWYEEAVEWAAGYGIVKGLSETQFGPDVKITREQLATILYRYMANESRPSQGALDRYDDVDQISSWALEAMTWANVKGIITGMTATTLAPQGTATRAQIATILMRMDDM